MAAPDSQTGSFASSRRYKYTKVLDNRKHAIHGWDRVRGGGLQKLLELEPFEFLGNLPSCDTFINSPKPVSDSSHVR
jgi:hypothetical protein